VPNSLSNTVDEIDPRTYRIVRHFPVGLLPQHVTPSHDLKTLWVDNDFGNSLTPLDPRTGKPGRPIPVDDPYNLYFTLDGAYAIVVAEQRQRLDFRDPHTISTSPPTGASRWPAASSPVGCSCSTSPTSGSCATSRSASTRSPKT